MKALSTILFLLFHGTNCSAFGVSGESRFLTFSDLHFDPFYDTNLIRPLINSDYQKWNDIFLSSEQKQVSSYGKDSNFPLLISALEDMKSRIPGPDFIIITGDFMAHNFNENFIKYSGTVNTDSLNLFIKKNMQFVTWTILKYFPQTQIFPALGNDDADCGNYMVEPRGTFLKMLSEVWQPFVKTNYNERSLKKTFSKGGYCKLEFQLSKNTKLLVLNTIFFSKNYVNRCGDSLQDPGEKELEWLRKNLEQSKQKHNRIWLSYHIPPGIDVYGTINGKGNCEERILPVWKKRYNEEFLKIVKQYSDIIDLSFAGHFHRDDFRIIYDGNVPVSYIHLAPSISPVYYNNPGYQIFSYQKSDFRLLDYETYFIENLSATGLINWRKEYDFRDSYNQTSLSLSSLNSINSLILSDSTYRATYIKFYSVSNIKSFQGDYTTWYYNWCGLGHLTTEEYAKCLCTDSTGAK